MSPLQPDTILMFYHVEKLYEIIDSLYDVNYFLFLNWADETVRILDDLEFDRYSPREHVQREVTIGEFIMKKIREQSTVVIITHFPGRMNQEEPIEVHYQDPYKIDSGFLKIYEYSGKKIVKRINLDYIVHIGIDEFRG